MRCSLEFHDSTISGIVREDTSIRIDVEVYVHRWDLVGGRWKGTGWTRPVQITLRDCVIWTRPQFPIELDGGVLRIGQVTPIRVFRAVRG